MVVQKDSENTHNSLLTYQMLKFFVEGNGTNISILPFNQLSSTLIYNLKSKKSNGLLVLSLPSIRLPKPGQIGQILVPRRLWFQDPDQIQ